MIQYAVGKKNIEYIIPDSVTSIAEDAFAHCNNLINVTIPDSVLSIDMEGFYGCNNLTNATIGKGVSKIEPYVFSNCIKLKNISVSGDNENYCSVDGNLFNKAKTELIQYAIGKDDTEYIIPDGVTSIGAYAFENCKNLVHVTISDSVTNIGYAAFEYCINLTSVTIPVPANVTYIDEAFDGTDLCTVFYLGDEESWKNINISSWNQLSYAQKIYNATKKTYKFETNCESELSDITNYAVMSSPKISNGDKVVCWYDNENFDGCAVEFPYYGDATTLYALWSDRTGLSFEDAFLIEANKEYSVNISESGQSVCYEFTPKMSGKYRFYSKGSLSTNGCLYDEFYDRLKRRSDGGEGNNFEIIYKLTAGEKYYIEVELSGKETGSFTFVAETTGFIGTKTVCVTSATGEKIFISIPSYLPLGASVILACYKDDMLEDIQVVPNIDDTLYFIVKKDFDSAKVMVWDSLSSMNPECKAEEIELY